jgi:hypothetical protein
MTTVFILQGDSLAVLSIGFNDHCDAVAIVRRYDPAIILEVITNSDCITGYRCLNHEGT